MLTPIKLKLSLFEAEALRRYCMRMLEIAQDRDARTEVITVAEWAPRIDSRVRNKVFTGNSKPATYAIPLSVARILWYRLQREQISEYLQPVLNHLDQTLLNANRRPEFQHKIL